MRTLRTILKYSGMLSIIIAFVIIVGGANSVTFSDTLKYWGIGLLLIGCGYLALRNSDQEV
jgi:hypothetical protein